MHCMSGFFLSTTELQTTQCSTIMKSKALVSKLMNAVDRLPAEEVCFVSEGHIQVEVLERTAKKCLKRICF